MAETMRPGESKTVTVSASVGEAGLHGALILTRAELRRQDGSVLDLSPASAILRETVSASTGTGTVGSPPSFSAGGGPAGEDVYSIALGSGEASDLAANDYVRSSGSGRGGVYKVLSKASDTIKVHAATGEMDVANSDTLQKVTPTGNYTVDLDAFGYADMNGQGAVLVVEIAGLGADDRGDSPAVTTAFTDEHKTAFDLGAPLSLAFTTTQSV